MRHLRAPSPIAASQPFPRGVQNLLPHADIPEVPPKDSHVGSGLEAGLDRGKRAMAKQIRMFGEAAFEKGFITIAQLYEALTYQAKMEASGQRRKFLGEILVDLGYMNDKQVLEVLNELHDVERDGVT